MEPLRKIEGVPSLAVSVHPVKSTGKVVVFLISIHSSFAEAEVPIQASSLITTSSGEAEILALTCLTDVQCRKAKRNKTPNVPYTIDAKKRSLSTASRRILTVLEKLCLEMC
jgi:hypothetical protein